METRLASTWRMTLNEKKFIETALASDLRIDGRNPLEYRKITIKFGREDGSSEVLLGHTHVMGYVTCQLVQPYRDRPNEGSLSIFTEFSPMADPTFEPGRPGEFAVELGRVIDRGLRESRAVDTESLCVLAGKLVWAIRIDLHILDNGGNLVDAANIAALAALLTFRRPECTLGGEDGQQVIVHPPEVKEPLPLIVHHLPIAVTFAFFNGERSMVVDPTHNEEAVMGGRMTVTVNANGDICAIQKAGGEGVMQSDIMRCLRLASRNSESITKKIKDAVETYNTARALRKIKRQSSVAENVNIAGDNGREHENKSFMCKGITELSRHQIEKLKIKAEETCIRNNDADTGLRSSQQGGTTFRDGNASNFLGGLSSWDPYSKDIYLDSSKASVGSQGLATPVEQKGERKSIQANQEKAPEDTKPTTPAADTSETGLQMSEAKTLKDAIKPKNKRRKRTSSSMNAS
ncbi:exosome complex component RRP45A isoform X2 [Jatropha curcas]|uniref:exosome complex component RRP45A isoform X2 n=1 Tax=Jatropha curcas TaxID=180498 RepID=UPI001894EEAB|nr:exosome complex component RRP45A isoform X2 [Jatropha curcas]